jgi:holliday junction DNA helicase RuvA
MFEHLTGKLCEVSPSHCVIECGGVGYLIQISLNKYTALGKSETAKLLIHYAVSVDVRSGESKHVLYGFSAARERDLFRLLITVSGVSAGIARTILSTLPTDKVFDAIASGDAGTINSVKGIGPKTAQKIVTELRDKMSLSKGEKTFFADKSNSQRNDALMALSSLGMDRIKAEKTLGLVITKHGEDLPLEELIRLTLREI